MALRLVVILAALASSANAADTTSVSTFVEGDFCNVTSRDFLNLDFVSNYAVAGEGCANSNSSDTDGCYCAPVLNNDEALSDWTWQCGDAVQFGPKTNKTCPAQVPVAQGFKGNENSTDTSVESALGVGAYCDLGTHPGGRFGDEACAYSTCEDGGDYSAVCACVDLEGRGIEGGGQQWFCLHSKCGCDVNAEIAAPEEEPEEPETEGDSATPSAPAPTPTATTGTTATTGNSGAATAAAAVSFMTVATVTSMVVSLI